MASLQFDTTTRNARADAVETSIGTSPTMKIRSGAKPANCAAADAGSVLATLPLPSDWLSNASGGVKGMSGSWQDNAADAAGTAGHYRIYDAGGVCRMQGDITASGGGGAMELDNTVFAVGQQFTVTSFQWTEGNA